MRFNSKPIPPGSELNDLIPLRSLPSGFMLSRISGKLRSVLFSLKNSTSIIPELYPASHSTYTVSAGYVETSDSYLLSLPTNCAKFKYGRYVWNLATYSEDLSNAAWVKANCSASGSTLTASAGNATCLQTWTGTNNKPVLRCAIKRVTGTGNIDLTVDGGSTWTTVSVTTTEQVFTITQSAETNPQFGVRIVTNGDKITYNELQLEDKISYATADQGIPSEYASTNVLSSPYYGCNVDGIIALNVELENTVSTNVLTVVTSTTLLSPLPRHQYEPQATNLAIESSNFGNWDNTLNGGVTRTVNNRIGLEGETSMALLAQIDGTGDALSDAWTLAASTQYTVTFTIEGNSSTQTKLDIYDDNAVASLANLVVTWTGKVPSTSSSSGASDIAYTLKRDDMYEVSFKVTTAVTVTTHQAQVYPESSATATNSIWLDYVQIEEGNKTSRIDTAGSAQTRNAVIHGDVWPTGLVNNFSIAFSYTHGIPSASILGAGTLNERLAIHINSSGNLRAFVEISSTQYVIVSNSSLTASQTYDIELIYDGGMSMKIDGTTQTDTDAVTTDMGWSDPEVLYTGSDYATNSGQICEITDMVIKPL